MRQLDPVELEHVTGGSSDDPSTYIDSGMIPPHS
jgi:hypothetical protein